MRVLAVDTAASACGVALAHQGSIEVAVRLDTGQTHTRTIMDAIASALRFRGIDLTHVDGFAVTRGPGSFTGLRIGISTVKGLAAATEKPVAGVSTLEALANQADTECELICPMIDARRGEVYWTLYRRRHRELIAEVPEQVGPVEKAVRHIDSPCCFIGNGVSVYDKKIASLLRFPWHRPSEDDNRLDPSAVARLGWRMFQAGDIQDPATIDPVYLRKSDAQIQFGKSA
jgi:tRNA threonylcarbamoyladenosine biosynthesis protein TsaB